jgi:hypothetical protein
MTPTSLPRRVAILLAVALLGAACGGDPAPVPAPTATEGESPEVKALRERASKLKEETERQWDEHSRGLLASFASRAYDPRRDAGLRHAEGVMRVRDGAAEASYRFVFDEAHPAERPVAFETLAEPEGWDAQLTARARRIALQSFIGPYRIVAFHNPPHGLVLHPGKEKGTFVIHAPPFRSPLNVSYSIDARQIVTARGEWTDETKKAVTNYAWDDYHNRYLVRRESIHDGAEIDYEYDLGQDLVLVKRAVIRDGSRRAEVVFEDVTTRRK